MHSLTGPIPELHLSAAASKATPPKSYNSCILSIHCLSTYTPSRRESATEEVDAEGVLL